MDILEISKALSNKSRLEILRWLKQPEEHFPPHKEINHFDDGVCGQNIQVKTGLSQSTVSQYLSQMEKIGFLVSTRHGKWTYFKRNDKMINDYINLLKEKL